MTRLYKGWTNFETWVAFNEMANKREQDYDICMDCQNPSELRVFWEEFFKDDPSNKEIDIDEIDFREIFISLNS